MTKVYLMKAQRPTRANPKRKVWLLRWTTTDGRQPCEIIGDAAKVTKREAEAARRELQGKLDNDLAPRDRPKRMTLADFLGRDREVAALNLRPRSLTDLKLAGRHACDVLGETADVRHLDVADAIRVQAHLAKLGMAQATIVSIMRRLQGAFSRGVAMGLVTSNPFTPRTKRRPHGVSLPKLPEGAIRVYEPCEVEAMIGAASPWWATFIRLAYTSGLREGEMLNLLWADVDFTAGTVSAQTKKAGTFRAGETTYPILPWQTKSFYNRTVKIPAATVKDLRNFRDFHEPPRSAYVFLSLSRLEQLAERQTLPDKLVNNLSRDFRRIQDAAAEALSSDAEPYDWQHRTIHDLRRTYGTRMARHVPAHELRRLMGHSSINTTIRHYLAVGDDVAAKIEAAFCG